MKDEQSLVPQNMMSRMQALADEPVGIDKILKLDFVLLEALRYQKLLGKVTAMVLVLLKDNWEELQSKEMADIQEIWTRLGKMGFEPLSDPPSYSFESYVIARTGFEWTTISNLMRVARAWYFKQLPEKISIPKKVELVDPSTGEKTGEKIDFDPLEVDWTKLSLCTRPLKNGEMDQQSWGLLANPKTTFSQLRQETIKLPEAKGARRRIFVQDGLLMVYSPMLREPIIFGSIDLDSKNEDVIWATNRILIAIGAKVQ
jgi:hypothetical protein